MRKKKEEGKKRREEKEGDLHEGVEHVGVVE